ncbi:glutathione S-transferase [Silvimonas sp.]|uniref:glutathione S-transferase n=1 Tax=Silvimonas sp. TaxID=2650811 RepID=UPI0028415AE7|nr:glutathione S-transferase [Silvimonas sp.]MDR3428296.1 glutathione S-transferase [Silvimonas sp.]
MIPLLYTFRRCPYAIRARLAIAVSGVPVQQHEVVLRDKPAAMLACSPKGTVPVLQLPDGTVLEQSLDIMLWALNLADPEGWLQGEGWSVAAQELVAQNDGSFKFYLDRYKYPERYPEHSAVYYREQGELYLQQLEQRLQRQDWLAGDKPGLVDMAAFPFVRQFAHVDKTWFYQSPYPRLIAWLDNQLASALFAQVMQK